MTTADDERIDWEDYRLQNLHPRQQRVLRVLVRTEPTTVPELDAELSLSKPSIRGALGRLHDRGVAETDGHSLTTPQTKVWVSTL